MGFLIYDVILLILFVIFIGSFLYSRRKNLQKEGLLFLYRTTWGIKLIHYVGEKYQRTLKVLSYVSIAMGYFLMGCMLWLFYSVLKIYVFKPEIVQLIKVPPITPLIPYLPQVFKLDFLPPFYFTYWIIILAVIAITHEFSHGIFAAYNKVRIKKTGFGFFPFFFPIFLAAFVEPDEKQMNKKGKLKQMAILSAGTFANVITAIIFFGIICVFFTFAFTPSGVVFDTYTYSIVSFSDISQVNGISLENPTHQGVLDLIDKEGLNEVKVANNNYLITKDFLEKQNSQEMILLYDDAPAIREELNRAIIQIEDTKINNIESFRKELLKHSPGDTIEIITKTEEGIKTNEIILSGNPEDVTKPWLGVGFINQQRTGVMGAVFNALSSFKEEHVYYEPKFDGFSQFIYNLLWWMILISISVALVNMLPVGIFDGGRFFYLTILGITKSSKVAERTFKFLTYFFLFFLLVIMFFWAWSFF